MFLWFTNGAAEIPEGIPHEFEQFSDTSWLRVWHKFGPRKGTRHWNWDTAAANSREAKRGSSKEISHVAESKDGSCLWRKGPRTCGEIHLLAWLFRMSQKICILKIVLGIIFFCNNLINWNHNQILPKVDHVIAMVGKVAASPWAWWSSKQLWLWSCPCNGTPKKLFIGDWCARRCCRKYHRHWQSYGCFVFAIKRRGFKGVGPNDRGQDRLRKVLEQVRKVSILCPHVATLKISDSCTHCLVYTGWSWGATLYW